MSFNVHLFVAVPRRCRRVVARVLLGGLIGILALMSQPSAAMAQSQTNSALDAGASSGQLGLIDMVVLVDESGSETPASVADEKATTLEVASSLLNQQSRVTVIGFGGVNDPSANQDPTNVACPPTIAANPSVVSALFKLTEMSFVTSSRF